MKKFVIFAVVLAVVITVSEHLTAQSFLPPVYSTKTSAELMTYFGIAPGTDPVRYSALIRTLNEQVEKARKDLGAIAQTATENSNVPGVVVRPGTLRLIQDPSSSKSAFRIEIPVGLIGTMSDVAVYRVNLSLKNVATQQIIPLGEVPVTAEGGNRSYAHAQLGNASVAFVAKGGAKTFYVQMTKVIDSSIPAGTYVAVVSDVRFVTSANSPLRVLTPGQTQTNQVTYSTVTAAGALEISGVNVTNNGTRTDSKRISWQTNKNSDSLVRYGQSRGVYVGTVHVPESVTTHGLVVTGLWPGVTYYYVVESKDSNGVTKTSPEYTFTMPTSQTNDTGLQENPNRSTYVAPVTQTTYSDTGLNTNPANTVLLISSVGIAEVLGDATKRAVQWQTNVPSDSVVKYGTTPGSYGNNVAYNGSRVTTHRMEISNLLAGTKYYYMVESNDGKGGVAKSAEYSFIVPAPAAAPVEPRRRVIINSFQNYVKNAIANAGSIFGR